MSEQTTSEALGETLGSELRFSRTVPHPVKHVWEALMTDEGNEALLGPGARLTEKGQNWQADDGTHGVTRSFHPLEQVRFSFHRTDGGPGSMVEVELHPDGDSTEIEIIHTQLPATADPVWLAQRWEQALVRIAEDLV